MCYGDFCICVFAAIWSITQTGLHLGWCVWGKNMYECNYAINNGSFVYLWYLTYFYTDSCVTPDITGLPMIVQDLPNVDFAQPAFELNSTMVLEAEISKLKIEFPEESAAAQRTYNIFSTFIVVDSLWIITSVALLIGTCFDLDEEWALLFFFPWCAVSLFIVFFDVIATVWYGIDISYTYGITNWFFFIGAKSQSDFADLEAHMPKIVTTFPSIIMCSIFSRFVVIWFVNLCLFFRVSCAAVNAYRIYDEDSSDTSKDDPTGRLSKPNSSNKRPRTLQVKDLNSQRRIREWELYYGTDEDEEEPHAKPTRQRRCSKQKEMHLTVVGGYEGDRSNSPSPLFQHFSYLAFAFNERQQRMAVGSAGGRETQNSLRTHLPWSYTEDCSDIQITVRTPSK